MPKTPDPNSYTRPLNQLVLMEAFVQKVLQDTAFKDEELLKSMVTCEKTLPQKREMTYSYPDNRQKRYRSDEDRLALRTEIVGELFNQKILENDNNIKLGIGGAMPKEVRKEKKAFILTGLPASGKSWFASQISQQHGAAILDSDFAKRKLPEFHGNPSGATLVHKESDAIIFPKDDQPKDFETLFEKCVHLGINVVIPKIGHEPDGIMALAQTLKGAPWNYKEIHLILVSLDRRLSTSKAIDRFRDNGRYIPLSLIFDGYSNDPVVTYYRLKRQNATKKGDKKVFTSFGKILRNPESDEKNPVDSDPNSPAMTLKY